MKKLGVLFLGVLFFQISWAESDRCSENRHRFVSNENLVRVQISHYRDCHRLVRESMIRASSSNDPFSSAWMGVRNRHRGCRAYINYAQEILRDMNQERREYAASCRWMEADRMFNQSQANIGRARVLSSRLRESIEDGEFQWIEKIQGRVQVQVSGPQRTLASGSISEGSRSSPAN